MTAHDISLADAMIQRRGDDIARLFGRSPIRGVAELPDTERDR